MSGAFERIGPRTDQAAAVEDLARANLSRKLDRGETGTIEDSRAFAQARLASAFAAVALGHTVTWDPPAA